MKTLVSTVSTAFKDIMIPSAVKKSAVSSANLAPLNRDVFVSKNAFNGIYTDMASPSRKLDLAEFFDNGTFKIEIMREGEKIPVQNRWFYDEAEDTLKIVDKISGKTLLNTDGL